MPEKVDYNIDVKPILADKYFKCHAKDAKKQTANLRLDILGFDYDKTTEMFLRLLSQKS